MRANSNRSNVAPFVLCLQTVTSRSGVTKIEKDENQMKKETATETVTEATAVTGFAFHKIVNARLAAEGLTMTTKEGNVVTKRIPPQMIYNYTNGRINAGKVPFIALNDQGLIDLVTGQAWLDKYVAKLIAKVLVTVE